MTTDDSSNKKDNKTADDLLVELSGDTVMEILPYLLMAEKQGIPLGHIIADLFELMRE